MCGIAGIFCLDGSSRKHSSALLKMCNQMRRRGPDDEGYMLTSITGRVHSYYGNDTALKLGAGANIPGFPKEHIDSAIETSSLLALGHRRLSILDLSANGHQPMCVFNERYWIVFNGEIYNFGEVRTELEAQGISFLGGSDTEVLINAYAVWGKECLSQLNGMFAFAIWDNVDKVLFCARDRIGIKPFYYTIQNNCFIFASDIKTIIASGLYTPQPDMEGLYLAMAFGVAPRPKTAFRDVLALDQGCWMKVHANGNVEQERYWSVPINSQDQRMTENDAAELLIEQLTLSIKRQLVADVPIGTFMSGGIDSTTVSAIASRLHPGIKAFTLGFEASAPELDEIEQAKATAKLCKMEHIIHRVDPHESLGDLESWIEGYEEPFYSLSPSHIISKLVSQSNVKVVLNGLGGDELFAGYGWERRIWIWKLASTMKMLVRPCSRLLTRKGAKLRAISGAPTLDRFHTVLSARFCDEELQKLFQSPLVRKINTADYLHDAYASGLTFTDAIETFSYMDLVNYLGNHFVYRIDQMTMAHSIEGRFPFLDHLLVEAAFKIPSKYKVKDNVGKYILKKVSENYIAPQNISMKKKGFSLPVKQWMDGPLKMSVSQKLQSLQSRELFNAGTIGKWHLEYLAGKRDHMQLWHLVALELWFEKFIEGKKLDFSFG